MMAIVAIVFFQLLVFQQSHCKEICRSEACKEEASNMLEAMNKTIDPCDDFYEFACRGWITKNPIPRGDHLWNSMVKIEENVLANIHNILDAPDKKGDSRPLKMARAMYRSCMDLETNEKVGLRPVHDALKKLGLPKTVPTDDEAKRLDLAEIAGLARRYFNIDMFAKLEIGQDPRNTALHVVLINQPKLIFEGLEFVLQNPSRKKFLVDAMKSYVNEMMKLAGAGTKSNQYATEFMDFLTELSKIMGTGNGGTFEGSISVIDRAMAPFTTKWKWETFMNNVFKETNIIPNSRTDRVVMGDGNYFKGWPQLLEKTPIETLIRAAYFTAFHSIAVKSTNAGAALYGKFSRNVYHKGNNLPKWYECTKLANEHFDIAITVAFVEKYFSEQEKKKVTEMWNDVRSSFDDMLNELEWMDSGTKSQAHKKLHAMASLIAYPDWITDRRKLEKYYEEYNVFEGKLYESIALAKAIEIKRNLNTWKQIADRNEWPESATTVNAFYNPLMNSVAIPVGILHIPFYGSGVEALNYGAIGAVLGHELTHGFDNTGRRFDETGNYRNWWSSSTLQHYLQKVQCMIKQYTGFQVTQLGGRYRVNGENTQGENIADNGGLTEAYRAYKKLRDRSKPQKGLPGLVKYSDEQLFFLGFAQSWCGSYSDMQLKANIEQGVHPPSRYRVMGTLQNSDEFAKAWNCRLGSRMNPRNKCIVW